MRTAVVIIGAGPAGLLLGRLLERAGVDAIILERRSPGRVLSRIRAGVLEPGTAALVDEAAEALVGHYRTGNDAGLEAYSARSLAAVWKAERFSWWMTSLLHAFPQADGFDRRIQRAEFDALASSDHAAALLARDYTGLSRL